MTAVDDARAWLAAQGVPVDQPVPADIDDPLLAPVDAEGDGEGSSPATRRDRRAGEHSSGDCSPRGRSAGGRPISGERTRPGSRRTVGRSGSADADPGSEFDDDPPDSMSAAEAEALARTVVLRKLAARARTRQELSRALTAREVPTPVAERVLDRMQEVGLVDDAAFAADWVESRQARRQLSASALRQELKAKGVAPESVEAALDGVDADQEYESALALAHRRSRSTDGLAYEVRYRRLAGLLTRRGFSSGLVVRVLSEVLDRP